MDNNEIYNKKLAGLRKMFLQGKLSAHNYLRLKFQLIEKYKGNMAMVEEVFEIGK